MILVGQVEIMTIDLSTIWSMVSAGAAEAARRCEGSREQECEYGENGALR